MIKFVTSHPFFVLIISLWLGVLIALAIQSRRALISANIQPRFRFQDLHALASRVDWVHARPAALLFLGLIDLPIFFFTIAVSGKLWTHYYVPIFPAMLLLLGGSLAYLYQMVAAPSKRTLIHSLLVAVLVIGSFPVLLQVVNCLSHPAGGDDRSAAAAYLKSATSPQDTILVWGWESVIYFLAQRDAPTRFALPFAFYVNTPFLDQYAAILLKEVEARPPAFIADLRDPGMPLIDGRPAETCLSGNKMYSKGMVDFLAFICANYEEDRSFERINIYKQR